MQKPFEILFLIGNPGKISDALYILCEEEAFVKRILMCYISGTECRRKLKFGEVSLLDYQNF